MFSPTIEAQAIAQLTLNSPSYEKYNFIISMEIRLIKLVNAFEEKGWTLLGSADVTSDWWFEDIIKLVSTWHPVGTSLYFTLLTDPLLLHTKKVWCIGVSNTVPDGKHFTYLDEITLNDISKTNLDIWVDKVNKIVLK